MLPPAQEISQAPGLLLTRHNYTDRGFLEFWRRHELEDKKVTWVQQTRLFTHTRIPILVSFATRLHRYCTNTISPLAGERTGVVIPKAVGHLIGDKKTVPARNKAAIHTPPTHTTTNKAMHRRSYPHSESSRVPRGIFMIQAINTTMQKISIKFLGETLKCEQRGGPITANSRHGIVVPRSKSSCLFEEYTPSTSIHM